MEKCQIVLNETDCQSSGFIQYSIFLYCDVPESIRWLAMIPLVSWFVLLKQLVINWINNDYSIDFGLIILRSNSIDFGLII